MSVAKVMVILSFTTVVQQYDEIPNFYNHMTARRTDHSISDSWMIAPQDLDSSEEGDR